MTFAEMKKEFLKMMQGAARQHSRLRVFEDMLEMYALSISNAVDKSQWDRREARYLEVVKMYERKDLDEIIKAVAYIAPMLESNPSDVLGDLYMSMDFGNRAHGQFFTPYHLSKVMAGMTLQPEYIRDAIRANGFMTILEPACGAGGMCVAAASTLDDLDCRGHYHMQAIDISPVCVHMTYIQLSLLGIPAIVHLGNTLSMEMREVWYTPVHIFEGWSFKLRRATQAPLQMRRTKWPEDDEDTPEVPVVAQVQASAPVKKRKQKTLF